MREYIQEKLDTPVRRLALGLGPRHRHLRHRFRRGSAVAACRAPNATRSTACAFPPRKCASSTSSWPSAISPPGARSPASGRAARRSSFRRGRAPRVPPGIPPAASTLPRRRPRRHHRRPGCPQRGRRASRLSNDQRREVVDMGRRYGVSLDHARKVAISPPAVYRAPAPAPMPPGCGKLLEAAAYLHDVGIS